MAIIRARQRSLTSVLPHQGNRRYAVQNLPRASFQGDINSKEVWPVPGWGYTPGRTFGGTTNGAGGKENTAVEFILAGIPPGFTARNARLQFIWQGRGGAPGVVNGELRGDERVSAPEYGPANVIEPGQGGAWAFTAGIPLSFDTAAEPDGYADIDITDLFNEATSTQAGWWDGNRRLNIAFYSLTTDQDTRIRVSRGPTDPLIPGEVPGRGQTPLLRLA